MMNNNTQVSLRNGANFSRIRKAQFGAKIPKLLIGGITHQSGDWYNTIFSSFRELMLADLARTKTPEEKAAIIKKYNDQQSAYGVLRPQFTDLSSVKFNQNVKDYLDLINNQFSFVNSSGINNGVSTNRYHKVGTANRIGKDLVDKWESDGYWAGQTLDRTTLGYKGDWDEESDAFKTWQKSLNDIGMETYLDTDNTYKLRLLPLSSNNTTLLSNDGTDSNDSSSNNGQADAYSPVEYPLTQDNNKRGKWRFPTFPLYNAALLGVANLTNKRILDTQLKAPSMRYLGWDPYAKVTNAYSERSGNLQALQEYNQELLQQINNSNDIGKRNQLEEKLRKAELDTKLENNRAKLNEFNQTTQNFMNVENMGKQIRSNIANLNRWAYVSEARDRLNAIAQYQALRGLNLQENIMANYTDWKAWNRNNQLQDYADWRNGEIAKVQNDLNKAWEDYQGSGNLENYQGYKDFWNNLYENGNPRADSKFGTAWAAQLESGVEDTAANRLKFFQENYNNADYAPELGSFATDWQKYQSDAMQNYIKNRQAIESRWGLLDARSKPINFDGEVSSWLYNRMNPRGSYQSIYMKKGGRFLKYLEHNRRAEKEIRDTTMKSMSESRKMLKRDLDALDRESLLLLRAIFK